MLTLRKNSLKYKDENGVMQDSGVLFSSGTTEVDETLSKSGMAADAKAVGDELDKLSEEISEDITNIANDINNERNERLASEKVLTERMNTFTTLPEGSTSGDVELADARIDFNGNTHANVGEHIRNVTGRLSEEIVGQETLINNKTGKYVTPEQFGAKCDNGWSDDAKAVQDCLDYARENGLAVRGFGAYSIYSPITITGKYQDVYFKQITYHGTDYGVTVKTQYSLVSINLLYAPNSAGINCISDESIACIYNKFNFSNVLTSGICIHVGNIDGETRTVASYNSFSTCWLKSSTENCIKVINLNGGENSFNGNSASIDAPNDYAFYFKIGGTIDVDKFAIETGCKSGFYVEDTKVVAGYIRTRECMDTKRIDSGDKGLMLKLVGMAHFYSDFTHIDVTCIDISELDHLFDDPNHLIYDEESICYVKAGRYCSSFYYGDIRKAYDIPGYIRMTGPYMFLDYEGRQIYHDFTENLDMREWGILPPNVLDIHADGDFILNNAYCANGISVITVNQTYNHFVVIKDKNENVIFNGAEHGAGTYQLHCFVSRASNDTHEWLYNPDFDTWKLLKIFNAE